MSVRTIHARTEQPVSIFREAIAVIVNLDTAEATVKQVRKNIRSNHLISFPVFVKCKKETKEIKYLFLYIVLFCYEMFN